MYQQIEANRRNTLLLTASMALLLMALGYLLGAFLFGVPWAGLGLGLVLAVILATISYFSGSSILLRAVNAHEIQKADDPQLFNVVEELSLAAGLPMPKIYLIDDPAPNAFATGRDPDHGIVAITKGLREKLTRDELQGVMAHELGHIQNRDILYMTMLAVMVGAIVLLADIYRRSMYLRSFTGGSRRDSRSARGSPAQAVLIVVGLLLAALAPLLATVIQMAASRQREYLADATAALLTRYPEGLASALEKIAHDKEELKVPSRALQALFILNPVRKRTYSGSLFDSHPPLEERIKRLRGMGQSATVS
jgi:heat shock protein HtpX